MNEQVFLANGDSPYAQSDLVFVLLRHKKKVLTFFCLTMGIVVAFLWLAPRKYQSEAKLFVRLGKESVTLDPTATTGQTVAVNESRTSEINSMLEILKSRMMVEKVVEAIGPETILASPSKAAKFDRASTVSVGWLNGLFDRFQLDPISDRERAITQITNSIEFSAAKESNVITIGCKASTPDLAQQIVAALSDSYLEEHLRINRTAGSYKFFLGQTELLEQELGQATQELRNAKNEFGLVSIEGQRRIYEDQIAAVESEVLRAETALVSSESKIRALDKLRSTLPVKQITHEVDGIANQAADEMREELFRLQIQQGELLARYTEAHPFVSAIRRQVRDAQQILDDQPTQRTHRTTAVDPVRQKLDSDFLSEKANAASLRTQVASLKEQQALVREKLKPLNNHTLRIEELQRQADILDGKYRIHSEKLEQARVDEALEDERISNVNVVQSATFVEKPVSPRKLLTLMVGLVLATFVGLGAAFTAEYRERSLMRPAQVVQAAPLPVRQSVPES